VRGAKAAKGAAAAAVAAAAAAAAAEPRDADAAAAAEAAEAEAEAVGAAGTGAEAGAGAGDADEPPPLREDSAHKSKNKSIRAGQGVVENKQSIDVETPPSPPRVCMHVYPEGKSCSDIGPVACCQGPCSAGSKRPVDVTNSQEREADAKRRRA
jgi:hypothetical protein